MTKPPIHPSLTSSFGSHASSDSFPPNSGFARLAQSRQLEREKKSQHKALAGELNALLEKEKISAQFSREISALSKNSHAADFWNEILQLGIRLKDRNQDKAAAVVFSFLQEKGLGHDEVRQRAKAEWEAMAGMGSGGRRWEYLISRFTDQATDAKMIVPMLAGSTVFNLARTATMGRLAGMAGRTWYNTGLGARITAGSLGFALEVPTFSLMSRGLHQLNGDPVAWDFTSVGKDLLGTAITLGALKLSNAGGQKLLGASPPPFARTAVPQATTFLGLMAAHRLEGHFQLRPEVDGATTVIDTLSSMVSLGVGAHLGHRMLGPGFAGFQKEMEIRTASQTPPPARNFAVFPEIKEAYSVLAPAGGPGRAPKDPGSAPKFRPWMAMTVNHNKEIQGRIRNTGEIATQSTNPENKKTPSAKQLKASIQKQIEAGIVGEDKAMVDEYAAALEMVSKKPGSQSALAALSLAFLADTENAFDLLLTYRDLSSAQSTDLGRATAKHALHLAKTAPELLGSVLRIAEAFEHRGPKGMPSPKSENLNDLFFGVQVLAQMSRGFSQIALENLTAPALLKSNFSFKIPAALTLLRAFRAMGELPPEQIREILPYVETLLATVIGQPWKGKAQDLQVKANLAEKMFRRLHWFPRFPSQAPEVFRLVNSMERMADVEGTWLEFMKLADAAKLSPERIFQSWEALQIERGVETALGIFSDHETISQLIPSELAAALVTDPGYISDSRDRPFSHQDLFALSYEPRIQATFFRFIRHRHEYPELGSPFRYIGAFAEMAYLQVEGYSPEAEPSRSPLSFDKGVTPRQQELFFEMVKTLRPEASSSAPPPPPDKAFLEWGSYRHQHPDKDFRPKGGLLTLDDNSLILTKNRYFLQFARGLPGSSWAQETTQSLLESIQRLGQRPLDHRPFFRLDMALNVLRVLGSQTPFRVDLSEMIKKDLEEIRNERGEDRGLFMARWIHRLNKQRPENYLAVIEMILEAALQPPPSNLNRFHPSSESAALVTIESLIQPHVEAILESLPLSDGAKRNLRKMKGMAERLRRSEDELRDREARDAVESVFYTLRSREEEIEENTYGLLSGPLNRDRLLSENPSASSPSQAPDEKPDPAVSTALATVIRENQLAISRFEQNPRTGMMEMNLGGDVRVAVWHAVAPVSAHTAHELRKDWENATASDHGEAYREFQALERERAEGGGTALIPQAQSSALVVASRLDEVRQLDSVKMMFRARFQDDDPEKMMINKIVAAMSMRLGLDLVELRLQQAKKDKKLELKDVKDLNRYVPNATTLEVALVSLTEKAPRLFLDPVGVSMPYRVLVSGIEWANDAYDPATQRQGLFSVDPYQYLGITGAGTGTEYTYFHRHLRSLIETALKTQLTDRHFFRHFWNQHSEAALAGLKRLREQGDTRRLLNKKVVDVDLDAELKISEIARLIGLLQKIPHSLNSPEAAKIYYKPFAGGVLFLNQEGEPEEFIPYHPHLQRVGMQEVHYKTEGDMSDDNRMAHQFLGEKLTGELFQGALEQTGGETSALEDRIMDFLAKYRIALPLAIRSSMDPTDKAPTVFFSTRSLKMGIQEVEALDQTLELVPPSVLAQARDGTSFGGGIRVIRKHHSPHVNFVDWSRNAGTLGFYLPKDKAITIEHMQEMPYANLDPLGRQLWRDTILHEVGEAFFDSLPPELKEEVVSLYPWQLATIGGGANGARVPAPIVLAMIENPFERGELVLGFSNQELARHVLTSYSSSNPRDLFCENFMAYLAHGAEFREKAKGSEYLRRFYDWLKARVFSRDGLAYESAYSPEAALAEMEKQITRWKMEESKQREDVSLAEAHEDAKANFFPEYITSIEAEKEKDFKEGMRELLAADNYVEAFYKMAIYDETGRGLRNRMASAKESFAGFPDWEKRLLAAMAESLKFDAFSGHRKIATRKLALKLWEAMAAGKPIRARELLERKIERVLHRYGDEIDMETDASEIWDLMVDVAASKMADGASMESKVVQLLSHYILPGRFTMEDLAELQSILKNTQFKDLEIIRGLYRFFQGKPRWALTPDQISALTAEIADQTTYLARKMTPQKLREVIVALTKGAEDIYQIASRLRLSPGQIDAFAETFLERQQYNSLLERSEDAGLKLQLQTSLLIHHSLKSEWERHFAGDEPPSELLEGTNRIEQALAALESNDPGAKSLAREILSDSAHSSRVEARARDLFHIDIKKNANGSQTHQ